MWPSANEHPILRLKAVLQDSDRHTGSGRNMLVIGAGRKENKISLKAPTENKVTCEAGLSIALMF